MKILSQSFAVKFVLFFFLLIVPACFTVMVFSFSVNLFYLEDKIKKLESLTEELLNLEKIGTVKVYSYSNRVKETDSTPDVTASGSPVNNGVIACSRDFLKQKILIYRDVVYIPGEGFYWLADLMNKRHRRTVDIFSFSHSWVDRIFRHGQTKNIYKLGRAKNGKQRDFIFN